ncbi:prephenate dehydratase [Cerasicoccus arenae]|uniref:Bifunctional chorismate mutase/prephenate dehydratase n=1 Tax=Cerasicoccus arenae TaxID=424488 RepID=A0A8J3DFQ2_9BACT|nr:prephenate dehydratase [Cerasicoccus arenae]MBK1858995.1 prephenate dehydratase [Cerasicoccus arenae]GHB94582.1 P-protein [Cerasicoccus arenae]
MDLGPVREKIDGIDREIIAKLNERFRLASEVARVKHKAGLPIYHPGREEALLRKLAEINPGPLSESGMRAIYREIISAMISLEAPMTIAYLGPEATYTEQAARKNFGTQPNYAPMPTIPDVFAAVEKGEADHGVIPIENSTGGVVSHSIDMLAETDLTIINQVYLSIEHCLISQSPLEEVREVRSKDQALAQCREWLARHLPHAQQVDADSTAQAVKQAGELKGVAAIASELAAEKYEVPILAKGIQDRANNVTRFLVLGREPVGSGTGHDRTSLLLSLNDEPGALEKALKPFSSRGINMTKIESRPSRRKAWDYLFYIDIDGHWSDEIVQAAVGELKACCPLVKWLGSYPVRG